jgi:hypothetical protein
LARWKIRINREGFFHRKEESSFSEEKEAKRLLFLVPWTGCCRGATQGEAARK